MIINIAKDFSKTPGPRYKKNGKFSGEEFRETILLPKFREAQKNHEKLTINLDGGFGYLISFLEEAFGGLARIVGPSEVLSIIDLQSLEEPSLHEEIISYIKNAKGKIPV
jgi:hypothetical protein